VPPTYLLLVQSVRVRVLRGTQQNNCEFFMAVGTVMGNLRLDPRAGTTVRLSTVTTTHGVFATAGATGMLQKYNFETGLHPTRHRHPSSQFRNPNITTAYCDLRDQHGGVSEMVQVHRQRLKRPQLRAKRTSEKANREKDDTVRETAYCLLFHHVIQSVASRRLNCSKN
jgi:hypothetical protein